jgi:hypothetical protein
MKPMKRKRENFIDLISENDDEILKNDDLKFKDEEFDLFN